MKRHAAIIVALMAISACEAPKPWSPYDDQGDGTKDTSASAPLATVAPGIDIGDAEQGVFVEAKIAPESMNASVKAEEIQDFRKFATKLTVDVSPPAPTEFWIDYTVRCSRDFVERPVVLRADIKVDDQTVDTIVAVLGANARKNTYTKKLNLLKTFPSPPSTLLATVTGTLLLMPEGAAEGTINPETAESSISSMALQATPVRWNVVQADAASVPGAPADATAPAPADAPAPAPVTTVQ